MANDKPKQAENDLTAGDLAPNSLPDEAEFLANYDPADYERGSIRVDVLIATVRDGALHVVTYTRTRHPYRGLDALPGEFLELVESLDECALRVVASRIASFDVYLEQLYTFGDVERDPRMRVISVVYYALVPAQWLTNLAPGVQLRRVVVPWAGECGDGAALVDSRDENIGIAFDHEVMLAELVGRLRGKVRYSPVSYGLLEDTFTLRELQVIHEAILGHPLNVTAFRRSILRDAPIESTGEKRGDSGRPAMLYRYVPNGPEFATL